jgi:serine/threonine protein kinase
VDFVKRALQPTSFRPLSSLPLHTRTFRFRFAHGSLGLSVMTVALGKFPFEEAARGGYWCLLQALKDQDVQTLHDLAGEEAFSEVFQSFLDLCLKKDPKERPSAEELLKHPFVRDVDLSSGCDGDASLEGEGSETARNEMEDIVGAVVQFYRKLWVKQSEGDVALTVPNFNKPKLQRLGNQIGLNVQLVQRKMRGLLKVLKGELKGVHSLDSARDRQDGEGSEHASSAYSSRGGGSKAWGASHGV